MTLKEYIEGLQRFIQENPDCIDMTVITASDDEGNAYSKIHYSPSIGVYKNKEFEIFNVEENAMTDMNAVLVN